MRASFGVSERARGEPCRPAPWPTLRRAAVLLSLLAARAEGRPSGGFIVVRSDPPVTELKRFEPGHPPPEMPRLRPDWAAVTVCEFSLGSLLSVRETREQGGEQAVEAEVVGVNLVAELRITSWLASDATDGLSRHEQGHRDICLAAHQGAERAGLTAARAILGTRYRGRGASRAEALDAARRRALERLTGVYDGLMGGPARAANQRFDRLTGHGRGHLVPEDLALSATRRHLVREQSHAAAHLQAARAPDAAPEPLLAAAPLVPPEDLPWVGRARPSGRE